MEYNEIGKIRETHGLKGELKIKTDSSFIDERFKVGATLFIKEKDSYKSLEVLTHRSMLNFELVSFRGYENVDLVTHFIGKTLYAIKDRSLLEENKYYYSDYIGLDVIQNGVKKGKVKKIESYPHDDYLIVTDLNEKEKLIPFRDEFIIDVNLNENTLTIIDMEGLL